MKPTMMKYILGAAALAFSLTGASANARAMGDGSPQVSGTQAKQPAPPAWFEAWYRAKYGRPSPLEEQRLKAEQANTAYRVETTSHAAQPANSWFEAWYQAKYGRPSPLEEQRLKAEQANTAYRVEKPSDVAQPANDWFEAWYRAKYGRPSPLEEQRLKTQAQ